jgi:hypothetical protein
MAPCPVQILTSSENSGNLSLSGCEDGVKTQASKRQGLTAGMDKSEGRSEANLLHFARTGDEAAFLVLYGRLKPGIFRYAFFTTNSQSAAEE